MNLDLTSDCDGIEILSSNLGDIGNISSGDSFQLEVEIQVDESVIIDDYFLNLLVSTDNVGDDGNTVVEEFSTNFSTNCLTRSQKCSTMFSTHFTLYFPDGNLQFLNLLFISNSLVTQFSKQTITINMKEILFSL